MGTVGQSVEAAAARLAHVGERGARAVILWAKGSRGCRRCASMVIVALVMVGASLYVRDHVEADGRYRVTRESILKLTPPAGLSAMAMADLARLPVPEKGFSMFEPQLVPSLVAMFERLAWVRGVRRVDLRFPAQLEIDLVVRQPAAGLRHGNRSFLIDEQGMVLPQQCYEPNQPESLRLPVIVNADLGRRRVREGELLEHVPVRHGVAVALALRAPDFDDLWREPVHIDVANVDGRVDPRCSEIVVRAGATTVEWGRSALSRKPHIPVSDKIAKLRGLLKREPNLARLELVRLQFDDIEWRKRAPVAAETAERSR